RTFRHQRTSAYDCMFTDRDIVQDYGAHADQAMGLNGAPVQHDTMTHRDVILEDQWTLELHDVSDRTVLDVGVLADPDEMNVAANDAVVPDAGMITNCNVSDHLGAFGNVNPLAQPGPFTLILVKHSSLRFYRRAHRPATVGTPPSAA